MGIARNVEKSYQRLTLEQRHIAQNVGGNRNLSEIMGKPLRFIAWCHGCKKFERMETWAFECPECKTVTYGESIILALSNKSIPDISFTLSCGHYMGYFFTKEICERTIKLHEMMEERPMER